MTTLDGPVSEIRAIELMATVDEHGHLVPDHALPIEINEWVRVLVLFQRTTQNLVSQQIASTENTDTTSP